MSRISRLSRAAAGRKSDETSRKDRRPTGRHAAPPAPPARPPSGRAPAARPPSGRQEPAKPPSAKPPSGRQEPAVEPQRSSRRRPNAAGGDPGAAKPKWRTYLPMIAVVGLILLLAVGAYAFPKVRRSMKLGEIREATDPQAALVLWREFAELVAQNQGELTAKLTATSPENGPVDVRLAFAQEMKIPGVPLRIATASSSAAIPAKAGQMSLRARALDVAADIMLADRDTATNLDGFINRSEIDTWLLQKGAVETDQDLARAGIRVLAAYGKPISGQEPANLLIDLINTKGQDPVLLQTAVENLHLVITPATVGRAIQALSAANGDVLIKDTGDPARQRPSVVATIAGQADPQQLPAVFALLDHENEKVQAAGMAILRGTGIGGRRGSIPPKDQEDMGRRVGIVLTAETREKKPTLFKEALAAVQNLGLVGARDQLFILMGVVPADSEEAKIIAATLGGTFLNSRNESVKALAEEVLDKLVAALDDPARRKTAAAALNQIVHKGLSGLRQAVEKLIALADQEPACFPVASRLVSDLFERPDVVKVCGDNLKAWRDFLAKDRPRYAEFLAIRTWREETNKKARATEGAPFLRQAQAKAEDNILIIEGWQRESSRTPLPLGLLPEHLADQVRLLRLLKESLFKAMPAL